MADNTWFSWLDKSAKGRVNCLAYSANTTMVPTVTKPFEVKASIPPAPATIVNDMLFNMFINLGIKPE